MNNIYKAFLNIVALCLIAGTFSSEAYAVNSQRFRPLPGIQGTFSINGTQSQEAGQVAIGLFTNFAKDTLILRTAPGGVFNRRVVDWAFTQDLVANVNLHKRISVGFDAPAGLLRVEQPIGAASRVTRYRMGDVQLNGQFVLIDSNSSPVGLSLNPFIELPTGSHNTFFGESGTILGGNLTAEGVLGASSIYGSLGFRGRTKGETVTGTGVTIPLDLGHEFTFGVGTRIAAVRDRLDVIGEFKGASITKNFFNKENAAPLEILGGVRAYFAQKTVALTVGGGAGILGGYGAPQYRVLAGLSLVPKVKKKEKTVVAPAALPTLESVYFKTAMDVLSSKSQKTLNENLAKMQKQSNANFVVEGNTDDRGSRAYNQKLSEDRANSVRVYLLQKGMDNNRVKSKGFGEDRPLVPNNSEENWAKNRRVDIKAY